MIDPFTIAAIASAVPAITQGITGLVQGKRAKDILNNLERPTYNIPTAQKEALGTARTLASSNQLPNQVQAEQGLDQATANALYNINQNSASGTEALAALTGVYSNQMGAENQLAGQGAMFANQQNQNLINELNKYAAYQDKEFSYNVDAPFQERRAEGQALQGASMQNKFNALKDVAGIGANLAMGMGAKSLKTDAMGNANATNQTMTYDPKKMPSSVMSGVENLSTLGGSQGIFNAPTVNYGGQELTTEQINQLAALMKIING